jgi:ATP-dependent Clp protease ATP-binding subunit ClpA
LFGKLVDGGEVKVHIKDNAPAFEITPAPPKPPKGRPAPPPPKAKRSRKTSGATPAAE